MHTCPALTPDRPEERQMRMGKQKAQQQHSKFLFDVAVQIEKLVNEPAVIASFRNQIQAFCKTVMSYCSQPDKKKAQNPLDWFRPKASLSHPLNEKERLMVDYVLLAVIHDNNLKPQWQRIYCGLGNLEVWPDFAVWAINSLWPWLRVWSDDRNKQHIEIYADSIRETEKIRTEIQLALEHVEADLARQPLGTDQEQEAINKPDSKNRKIFGETFNFHGIQINYRNLWHKIKNQPFVAKILKVIKRLLSHN